MVSAVINNKISRSDLLQLVDAVASTRNVSREDVFVAIEQAVQKAGKEKYGQELDVRANINRASGDIKLERFIEVCEDEDDVLLESYQNHISLEQARKRDANLEVGDFIHEPLPMVSFGRVGSQIGKQIVLHKISEAERAKQYDEYKDRVGQVISGIVKRVETSGNVILDLGHAEAFMRQKYTIPREDLRRGVRVRTYIHDVRNDTKGPQVYVSRTSPRFLVELFRQEVPEIYEGVVEIRAVARDPGSRAKIGVLSHDTSIDPVGACVGVRGVRVQAVAQELRGEKIDIVPWAPDLATFVVNSLSPAEISKVIVDEEERRVEVVADDSQLSLAIGRRGQNVRLASILTNCHIEILTTTQHNQRQQAEIEAATEAFTSALDIDELIAQVLVMEGFMTIEDIAEATDDELMGINGLTPEIAIELKTRASSYIAAQETKQLAQIKDMGVDPELLRVEGLTLPMIITLAENDIFSLDDFAGMTGGELANHSDGTLRSYKLDLGSADILVMRARLQAGWITEQDVIAVEQKVKEAKERRANAQEFSSLQAPLVSSKPSDPFNPFADQNATPSSATPSNENLHSNESPFSQQDTQVDGSQERSTAGNDLNQEHQEMH